MIIASLASRCSALCSPFRHRSLRANAGVGVGSDGQKIARFIGGNSRPPEAVHRGSTRVPIPVVMLHRNLVPEKADGTQSV